MHLTVRGLPPETYKLHRLSGFRPLPLTLVSINYLELNYVPHHSSADSYAISITLSELPGCSQIVNRT